MTCVRVVVVDDSAVCRELLRSLLEADGDIQVVGEGASGEAACSVIAQLQPDLATIDIQMPGVGGLGAIARIMADTPLPILVVTGQPRHAEAELTFAAVQLGALDLALKPDMHDASEAARLRSKVRQLASVPVVRHVGAHRDAEPWPVRKPTADGRVSSACRIVGIGASAGGPAACASVLAHLDSHFCAAVALVQHLPKGFSQSFAGFLAQRIELEVEVVRSSAKPRPRVVFIAPDDQHLIAAPGGTLVATEGPPLGGHRPSVNALFESLATVYGPAAAGVILSGIGDDGASGLLAMRQRGALTLVQDEASSIVYGMPRAAFELRAAQLSLPPDAIGRALNGFGAMPIATAGPR